MLLQLFSNLNIGLFTVMYNSKLVAATEQYIYHFHHVCFSPLFLPTSPVRQFAFRACCVPDFFRRLRVFSISHNSPRLQSDTSSPHCILASLFQALLVRDSVSSTFASRYLTSNISNFLSALRKVIIGLSVTLNFSFLQPLLCGSFTATPPSTTERSVCLS